MKSIVERTDSYKLTHWTQYPKGTTKVYSYFESRGGPSNEIVFFGLQYYLYEYLEGIRVSRRAIQKMEKLSMAHFGKPLFNAEGWEHVLMDHGGELPLEIKAVPEGSVWPIRTTLFTIENTCPKCYWLTNYVETLLVKVWYPSTVATISREAKKIILRYLEETGDPSTISFKLHDFGYRGVSSEESAGIGGLAHLVNFMGTDTLAALIFAQDYYNCDMAGFSVPAAEHSTITSWGRDHEKEAYENMLDAFPEGIVAVVSDSYDIFNACANIWGKELKNKVLSRNGTVVIRPDSGDPAETVLKVILELMAAFGYTVNDKGYKVLPPEVRVIQGDGITLDSIPEILERLKENLISADNIGFGMGGGLLQKCDRDTFNFAMKCSAITINGEEFPVSKSPVGDPMKKSAGGRKQVLVDGIDQLATVFLNGEMKVVVDFAEVRKNGAIS